MSKKSRAARRAEAKIVHKNGKPRPITPQKVQVGKVEPTLLPIKQRPLWLDERDATFLIELLLIHEPKGSLVARVKQVKREIFDSATHLHELEVTARANGFWEDDKGTIAKLVKQKRKELKQERVHLEQEIAHLPVEEILASERLREMTETTKEEDDATAHQG